MKRMRWGLLALGGIARKFAADLRSQGLPIQAVASRDEAKARAFAAEFGAARAYGDYAYLLADPEVDAVYIAAPNTLHVPWTLAAARAGKHVLCEKPFALDADEAEKALLEVGRAGVFFMEAFMYRCHPQWQKVRELLREGAVGELRLLQAHFSYDLGDQMENIRLSPSLSGGALWDVGCYCVNFARWMTGEEPSQFGGLAHVGAQTGVDEWMAGSLLFPSGALASFQCAAKVAQPSSAVIYGGKGRIEIASPWHIPPSGGAIRLVQGGKRKTFHAGDGLPLFAREALIVEKAVEAGLKESPFMPWSETLKQAAAMAALRRGLGLV